MSQLDSAISTLTDEHGTFITKASDYHRRKNPARNEAVSDATGAEQARDGAQASETTTDLHEADALVARDTAQADQRAAAAAKREATEQVTQAKRARLHAEAVQAGDLDRYTQWLLDSPVANGTLKLDFATQTYELIDGRSVKSKPFADVMTFTRASTKWVWNATGTLVEVPIDQPAYDHDPVTGEPLGVLIEESRTNTVPTSDISTVAYGTSLITAAPSAKFGGHSYRIEATDNTHAGARYNAPSLSTDSGTVRSVAVRAGELDQVEITVYTFGATTTHRFNLTTGGVDTLGSGDRLNHPTIEPLGDGWFLISSELGSASTNYTFFGFRGLRSDGTAPVAGEGFEAALPQSEAGGLATSRIPTAGAAVTRAADNIYRDMGEEFSTFPGTTIAEFQFRPNHPTGSTYGRGSLIFGYYQAGGSGYDDLIVTAMRNSYIDGSIKNSIPWRENVFLPSFGVGGSELLNDAQPHRAGMAVSSNNVILAVGGMSSSQEINTLTPFDQLRLDRGYSDGNAHKHLKYLDYYPYAMTAAELEALTTL